MPGLAGRRPVADIRAERRGHHHVPAHHHRSRDHHAGAPAHKEHAHKPREHDSRRGEHEAQLAEPVDKAPRHDAHDRREDQHHAEDYRIVRDAEVVLYVDDEVREEHLHRNREQAERRKRQIKLRVLPHDRRPEAVEQVLKIAVRAALKPRLVLHEEDGQHADKSHRKAEDIEELLPSPLLRQPVESAEDDKHRYKRQDGEHALRTAAVRVIRNVGDIGVEGRVVCRAAKEGHHAVHYDDEHRR